MVPVGLIVIFGGWAWEVLGARDDDYPFRRSGRFLHLLIAFAVLAGLGYIALTSLGVL
jgi:hypothetical protein